MNRILSKAYGCENYTSIKFRQYKDNKLHLKLLTFILAYKTAQCFWLLYQKKKLDEFHLR